MKSQSRSIESFRKWNVVFNPFKDISNFIQMILNMNISYLQKIGQKKSSFLLQYSYLSNFIIESRIKTDKDDHTILSSYIDGDKYLDFPKLFYLSLDYVQS